MQDLPRFRCALFAVISWVAVCSSAVGQEGSEDLATVYNRAMADFQGGNYSQAASALEALVARVAVSPQVEPIFFTIGSAYFNAADYPKAIAAFRNYQAKFPQGAHAGQAAFAIAQSNLLSKISRKRQPRWRLWKKMRSSVTRRFFLKRRLTKRPTSPTRRLLRWKN